MRYMRWWRRVILRKTEPAPAITIAQRIRLALEELGPTFVKFGQVISTRPDLRAGARSSRNSKNFRKTCTYPFSRGRREVRLVESELGAPLAKLYAEFDLQPLAAGSLGQVHRAVHFDGRPLAVKIRRPHVERDVERDVSLLTELAATPPGGMCRKPRSSTPWDW